MHLNNYAMILWMKKCKASFMCVIKIVLFTCSSGNSVTWTTNTILIITLAYYVFFLFHRNHVLCKECVGMSHRNNDLKTGEYGSTVPILP